MIILKKEHKVIIRELAARMDVSKSDIIYLLIEMGCTLLISSRRHAENGGLEKLIPLLDKQIQEDPNLIRMAQLLEKAYQAGADIENKTEKK